MYCIPLVIEFHVWDQRGEKSEMLLRREIMRNNRLVLGS